MNDMTAKEFLFQQPEFTQVEFTSEKSIFFHVAPNVYADLMERYTKQKLNSSGIGSKRPSPKLFCKVHSAMFGEQIDKPNQLVNHSLSGDELYELCLRFYEAACASGGEDTVAERGFTCYEIWRPNIPDNGCTEECKECARKSSEGQP